MKRGLKAILVTDDMHIIGVTILAPMKRGLKGAAFHIPSHRADVTILAPMKRGLKDTEAWEIPAALARLQSLPR